MRRACQAAVAAQCAATGGARRRRRRLRCRHQRLTPTEAATPPPAAHAEHTARCPRGHPAHASQVVSHLARRTVGASASGGKDGTTTSGAGTYPKESSCLQRCLELAPPCCAHQRCQLLCTRHCTLTAITAAAAGSLTSNGTRVGACATSRSDSRIADHGDRRATVCQHLEPARQLHANLTSVVVWMIARPHQL